MVEDVLVQIPVDGIDQVEELVTPFLDRLIPYTLGRLTTPDLLEMFRSAKAQLWLIWSVDERELLGVGSTVLKVYPQRKVCKAWMFIGEDYRRCYEKLEELENWARDQGCASMEITGRKGWARVFKEYEEVGCVLKKEI